MKSPTDAIDRRTVLKMTGATVAGGVGASGTALAGCEEVVFCGCGQVCVCPDKRTAGTSATVHQYDPSADDYKTFQVTIPEGGACVTPGDNPNDPGNPIVAITVGGTTYCNPNDDCAELSGITCEATGERGGPCGGGFLNDCNGNSTAPV